MAKRDVPEINAGSMADIAFLLLIFFLVTTTMDVDTGINRKLPEKQPEDMPEPPKLKEKNVFIVTVNRNNDILVEGETFMTVDQIREEAMNFIDNGGGLGNPIDGAEPAECDWPRFHKSRGATHVHHAAKTVNQIIYRKTPICSFSRKKLGRRAHYGRDTIFLLLFYVLLL